jgi:hypothetical protein
MRQGAVTPDMREKINDLQCRLHELRVELQGVRRMEQLNQEAMREAFAESMHKLKVKLYCAAVYVCVLREAGDIGPLFRQVC